MYCGLFHDENGVGGGMITHDDHTDCHNGVVETVREYYCGNCQSKLNMENIIECPGCKGYITCENCGTTHMAE